MISSEDLLKTHLPTSFMTTLPVLPPSDCRCLRVSVIADIVRLVNICITTVSRLSTPPVSPRRRYKFHAGVFLRGVNIWHTRDGSRSAAAVTATCSSTRASQPMADNYALATDEQKYRETDGYHHRVQLPL